jgi:hypothetical protein
VSREVWGAMGMDTAASSKNIAGGDDSSRIVKEMIGRGRGRVWVPGDAMVSVLDTTLWGTGADDEWHLPGMITLFFTIGGTVSSSV